MSKLLYTYFTKLIIDYILSHNKSIPSRSDSKLHSSQDDQPITKLLSANNGEYKFGMEVPDAMISDEIKKKAWYTYYMAKKVESEKAKIVDELEEQHVSLVKSGRGKGFMCYGDQVANVPNKLKKDVVPRKTRSLTIAEEAVVGELTQESRSQQRRRSQLTIDSQLDDTVADTYAEWGQKLKGLAVEDPAVQSLLDLQKGSKANRLRNDNPHEDDDAARYGVFMHKKSTATPNSTYLSLTEMFPDNNAHHIPSLPAKKIPYPTTTPQPNSLQAKAKKLMQKAEKNMRKINFKKAVAQKFKEYDQKLEAL
ncbi:hypothetical protein Tco_0699954, partial [Tanacetum coccineum]